MALSREEIAADLVWRYVEHIRSSDAEALTDVELEELAGVLKTLPATREGLAAEGEAARQAVVRQQIEQLLARSPRLTLAPAAPIPTPRPQRLIPAWRFRIAFGLAAALAVAVGTVGLWHRPPAKVVVQRRVIPRDIRGVDPMDEKQAHDLMPKMVHNQLSPKQEKDLMGHMLVCPGCFDHYVELKQHVRHLASRESFHLAALR